MNSKPNIVSLVLAEAENRSLKESRRSKSAQRAKFLAMIDDIERLIIKEKLPVQFIWKVLKDKGLMNCSYRTFLYYCQDYISNQNESIGQSIPGQKHNNSKISAGDSQADARPPDKTSAKPSLPPGRPTVSKEPIISKASSPSVFVFNNTPDDKDLF